MFHFCSLAAQPLLLQEQRGSLALWNNCVHPCPNWWKEDALPTPIPTDTQQDSHGRTSIPFMQELQNISTLVTQLKALLRGKVLLCECHVSITDNMFFS